MGKGTKNKWGTLIGRKLKMLEQIKNRKRLERLRSTLASARKLNGSWVLKGKKLTLIRTFACRNLKLSFCCSIPREFGGCENRGGIQTLKGVDISWDDHVCLASCFGERWLHKDLRSADFIRIWERWFEVCRYFEKYNYSKFSSKRFKSLVSSKHFSDEKIVILQINCIVK